MQYVSSATFVQGTSVWRWIPHWDTSENALGDEDRRTCSETQWDFSSEGQDEEISSYSSTSWDIKWRQENDRARATFSLSPLLDIWDARLMVQTLTIIQRRGKRWNLFLFHSSRVICTKLHPIYFCSKIDQIEWQIVDQSRFTFVRQVLTNQHSFYTWTRSNLCSNRLSWCNDWQWTRTIWKVHARRIS